MNTFDYKKYTWIAGMFALVGVFFVSFAMGLASLNEIKHPNGSRASITVTGMGEVTAIPDIATITATVRESAKTVPEAQKLVEAKITKALGKLNTLGVDKKDIKTLSYTVNPKYETNNIYCITVPCQQGKTVIVGYEVSENIQVKIRNLDKAGEVVGLLGGENFSEIYGPNFSVEDIEKAKAEAKAKAISNAKTKARETARALHERLGDVVQFSEDNGGYYPMMYGVGGGVSMKAEVSNVTMPQGESVIKSNVTITYSLR